MKKLFQSKKSMILYYIVIPGFFIGLMMFYIATMNSAGFDFDGFVGQEQINMVQKSQQAQKYLMYLDKSAELSANKAVVDLANNGGFALKSSCGDYLGYQLWTKDKECYPNYNLDFKAKLNENLKNYLSLFPDIENKADYNYFIRDKKLIGIADIPLKLELNKGKQLIGSYEFEPCFNIDMKYDLHMFKTIIIEAADLVDRCSDSKDLEVCIEDYTPNYWEIGTCEGDIALVDKQSAFCVRQQGLTYKFALSFE